MNKSFYEILFYFLIANSLFFIIINYSNTKNLPSNKPFYILEDNLKNNSQIKLNESNEKSLYTESPNVIINDKIESLDFNTYCDLYGEWEPLADRNDLNNNESANPAIYFKRNASFYFIDASFFRLHFLRQANNNPSLKLVLDVSINNILVLDKYELKSSLNIQAPWTVSAYSFNFLDAPFNLTQKIIDQNVAKVDSVYSFLKESIEGGN